jgi:hypothetical protein
MIDTMHFIYESNCQFSVTFHDQRYQGDGIAIMETNSAATVEFYIEFKHNIEWFNFLTRIRAIDPDYSLKWLCNINCYKTNNEFWMHYNNLLIVQNSLGALTRLKLYTYSEIYQVTNLKSFIIDHEITSYKYYLATPFFFGTSYITLGDGSQYLGRMNLRYDRDVIVLDLIPGYFDMRDEIIKSKQPTITASLSLRKNACNEYHNNIANDICDLISLSNRSPIQWVYYEALNSSNQVVVRVHRRSTLPNPVFGQPAIHDDHQHCFFETCLANYTELRRKYRFHLAAQYYIECQRTDYIQLKYVLLYITLGYIRSALKELYPEEPVAISFNLNKKHNCDAIETKLLEVLARYFPKQVAANGEYFRNKLTDLNKLPEYDVIQFFLAVHAITGFDRQHAQLRNDLFHAGKLGRFSIDDTVTLYKSLNRILTELILSCVGWRSYYLDYENGGVPKKVP